jgi:hypothetical protein
MNREEHKLPCQPETSRLPWKDAGYGWVDADNLEVAIKGSFYVMSEGRYALHASNCFPVLLDALLAVVKWDEETKDLNDPDEYEKVFAKVKSAIETAKGPSTQ